MFSLYISIFVYNPFKVQNIFAIFVCLRFSLFILFVCLLLVMSTCLFVYRLAETLGSLEMVNENFFPKFPFSVILYVGIVAYAMVRRARGQRNYRLYWPHSYRGSKG